MEMSERGKGSGRVLRFLQTFADAYCSTLPVRVLSKLKSRVLICDLISSRVVARVIPAGELDFSDCLGLLGLNCNSDSSGSRETRHVVDD